MQHETSNHFRLLGCGDSGAGISVAVVRRFIGGEWGGARDDVHRGSLLLRGAGGGTDRRGQRGAGAFDARSKPVHRSSKASIQSCGETFRATGGTALLLRM